MALAADRNTPLRPGELIHGPVAAATKIFAGALVMRTATGHLTEGATATGSVGVGRAEEQVDNSDGSAGDVSITVRPGIFRYKNSATTDAITVAEIGDPCFVVDDETVAKTNGTGTRSLAGFIHDVDDQGVWVRFDEALAQAYLAGIALP